MLVMLLRISLCHYRMPDIPDWGMPALDFNPLIPKLVYCHFQSCLFFKQEKIEWK